MTLTPDNIREATLLVDELIYLVLKRGDVAGCRGRLIDAIAEVVAERDIHKDAWRAAESENAALIVENDRLRVQLAKYGQHKMNCTVRSWIDSTSYGPACTCGWTAAQEQPR